MVISLFLFDTASFIASCFSIIKISLSNKWTAKLSEVTELRRRLLSNWHISMLNKSKSKQSCVTEKCKNGKRDQSERALNENHSNVPWMYVKHVHYGHWTQTKTPTTIGDKKWGKIWNLDSDMSALISPFESHVMSAINFDFILFRFVQLLSAALWLNGHVSVAKSRQIITVNFQLKFVCFFECAKFNSASSICSAKL